jgi:hypothetical protein
MDSGQKFEILNWYLSGLDAKFVVQLALSSVLHPSDRLFKLDTALAWNTKWMRAACVRPHIGEGNLLRRSLLQKQLILGVEKEDRESAV